MKKAILLGIWATAILVSFSENPWDWMFSSLAIALFIGLFLQRRQFPVLLLALLMPLAEIVLSLLSAELEDQTLQSMFGPGGPIAYRLSIGAYVLFIIGMSWVLKSKHCFVIRESDSRVLEQVPLRNLVFGHLGAHALFFISQMTFGYGSSLYQLTVHLRDLPLIFLYLIVWKYMIERRFALLVWVIFLSNLFLRITGFFSEWKDLLFLIVFVVFVVSADFDKRWFRRISIIGMLGGGALMTWQGVKAEYRSYLNGGARNQRVVVGAYDAFWQFAELSQAFWNEESQDDVSKEVLESTLNRIGYLEFFALTVERVPDVLPHECGRLITSNLEFALVPRILNPNKGYKNDQWKVERYANVPIADSSSFSLGRYAEWYVDFGSLMLLMALIMGALGGWIVRFVSRNDSPRSRLLDVIFLVLLLQNFCSYQLDEIVIYGQTFWALVVYESFGRRLLLMIFNPN